MEVCVCIPGFQASMMSAENDPLGPLPPGWGKIAVFLLSTLHIFSWFGYYIVIQCESHTYLGLAKTKKAVAVTAMLFTNCTELYVVFIYFMSVHWCRHVLPTRLCLY